MSPEQSMSGRVLRLVEGRPTRMLRRDRGTTAGSPGEGHASSLSWASYQSGSTHTSVTHCTGTGGATGGAAASGGAAEAWGAGEACDPSGAFGASEPSRAPGAPGADRPAAEASGRWAADAGPRSSAPGVPSP